MWHLTYKVLTAVFSAGLFLLPAFADSPAPRGPANPGTVNYLHGQVSIDSQPLSAGSNGMAVLGPNQSHSTGDGKAEVLLTTGVALRLGGKSVIRMISLYLAHTAGCVD